MQIKRVAANSNAVLPVGTIIRGVALFAGADAASVKLYEAATVTGTDILALNSPLADSRDIMLPGAGKKLTTLPLSVGLSGTSPVAYIFYD